jgi:hypothetical protein
MKQIVSVGFRIPDEIDHGAFDFHDNYSLADADIILFRPELEDNYLRLDFPPRFHGKPSYSSDASFQIKEATERWRDEINNAFNIGKTIVILLTRKSDFYVHTGRKEVRGTGRTQKVTDIVELYSNYKFLPLDDIKITHSIGSSVFCKNPKFRNFFDAFGENLVAENYIETGLDYEQVFCSKKGERTLACVFKGKNDGFLILLPNLIPLKGQSRKEPKNQKKWTEQSIVFGKKLKYHLLDLDRVLRSTDERSVPPTWISDDLYELENTRQVRKIIDANFAKINAIKTENERLIQVIEENDNLKGLLYETGKPLENAVIKALKILGYSAENYQDSNLELDQVIVSPEGERFIGECEGKDNKDIDISKFRQLLDNLNEDFQREEIQEKAFGLLFGNPQRLSEPISRTLDFTRKCKNGASRENIGLIITSDLYFACKYILDTQNENAKGLFRQAIKNQLGKVIEFPLIK